MTRRAWLGLGLSLLALALLAATESPRGGAVLAATVCAIAAVLCFNRAGVLK